MLLDAGVVEEDGLVYVPYYRPDRELHNRRVFAPDGRCWWETSGVDLLPYGLETLPPRRDVSRSVIFVCEGESDALTVRSGFAGTADGTILHFCALGVPGATTWRSEWAQYLRPYPTIYLLGDGDDAGRSLNARIRLDVPWARPVWLPDGRDARDIIQRNGAVALDLYLDRADREARIRAAFIRAESLSEFEALLREEALHAA